MNYNFETSGPRTPGQLSADWNGYINGFVGIQPDQGILQDIGTLIGHAMTAGNGTSYALQVRGENDQYNLSIHVNLFEQPKVPG